MRRWWRRQVIADCLGSHFDARAHADPAPAPTPTPAARFVAASGGALIGTTLFGVNGNGRIGDSGVLPDSSDADISGTTNRTGGFRRDAACRHTVMVPPAQPTAAIQAFGIASHVAATLAADGRVAVQRLTREVSFVWFEYDARTARGVTPAGRVYLRLNDDI